MRHAKSSWKDSSLEDHARPLNKRGRRDAPKVAAELIRLDWRPALVCCSDSTRTLQTWELMAPLISPSPTLIVSADLYHGASAEVRAAMATVPDDIQTLLLLGHNPGFEEVLYNLCGQHERLTTANAALLTAQGASWAELAELVHAWELDHVIRPKEL